MNIISVSLSIYLKVSKNPFEKEEEKDTCDLDYFYNCLLYTRDIIDLTKIFESDTGRGNTLSPTSGLSKVRGRSEATSETSRRIPSSIDSSLLGTAALRALIQV